VQIRISQLFQRVTPLKLKSSISVRREFATKARLDRAQPPSYEAGNGRESKSFVERQAEVLQRDIEWSPQTAKRLTSSMSWPQRMLRCDLHQRDHNGRKTAPSGHSV